MISGIINGERIVPIGRNFLKKRDNESDNR